MYQRYAFPSSEGGVPLHVRARIHFGTRWRLRFLVAPDEQLWVSFLVPSNLSTQLDSRRYRPGIVRLLANATVSSRFLSAQNLINLSQFSLGEIRVVQRPDILFQLGWGTRSDKSGGDDRQT